MTMRIGGVHNWNYKSRWREKKIAHGKWRFHSSQTKNRAGKQLEGFHSAPKGTTFVWGIRARQVLRKVSPNRYKGHMTGTKRFIKRFRH